MSSDLPNITVQFRSIRSAFSVFTEGQGEEYRKSLWNQMPGRPFNKCIETLILENVALAEAVWELQAKVKQLESAADEQKSDGD